MDTQHNELHDNRECKIHGAFTKFDDSKQENVCANCGQVIQPSTSPTPVSRTAEEIEQMAYEIYPHDVPIESPGDQCKNFHYRQAYISGFKKAMELYRTQPEEREERVRIDLKKIKFDGTYYNHPKTNSYTDCRKVIEELINWVKPTSVSDDIPVAPHQ